MAFDFDVSVRPIRNPQGKTVGFAQLTIDNEVWIDGFRIIDGANGLFIGAPNHKGKDKEGNDSYFDDVRFVGTREEDQKRTPLQEQIYALMIERYLEASVQNSRGGAAAAQAGAQSNQHQLWPS